MGKKKKKKPAKKSRLHFREKKEAGGHVHETVGADLRAARGQRDLGR